VQQKQTPSPSTDGWLQLPNRDTWEHASWLKSPHLADRPLREVVEREWCVVDNRSWTADERVAAVIATPGDFVALLRPSRRFDRLIDRRSLAAAVGERSAQSAKAG
jgi:hypothetical protein